MFPLYKEPTDMYFDFIISNGIIACNDILVHLFSYITFMMIFRRLDILFPFDHFFFDKKHLVILLLSSCLMFVIIVIALFVYNWTQTLVLTTIHQTSLTCLFIYIEKE